MVELHLRGPTMKAGIPDWTGLCRDPFFLTLLRPFRRDPCPEVPGLGVLLSGFAMAVGTKTDLKGWLCWGLPSERLPWEDTEEVDNAHEGRRVGLRKSGKLDVFLVELKTGMT